MRFGGLLVALILAVGLASTVVALHSREQNAQFVSQQRALAPVSRRALQQLILTTSDPRPGYARVRARAASCVAGSVAALGNPWSCVVHYGRPPAVRYRIIVHADRSIYGSGGPLGGPLSGVLSVSGCCVANGL